MKVMVYVLKTEQFNEYVRIEKLLQDAKVSCRLRDAFLRAYIAYLQLDGR
jgi:hypothetical protein